MRPFAQADGIAFENAFSEMGWDKPASQFSQYLQEQEAGHRTGLVAEWEGCVAGYLTILWESQPDEGPGRPAGRGLGAALVAGRILEGFLYQVSPRDPLVLLSAALAWWGWPSSLRTFRPGGPAGWTPSKPSTPSEQGHPPPRNREKEESQGLSSAVSKAAVGRPPSSRADETALVFSGDFTPACCSPSLSP